MLDGNPAHPPEHVGKLFNMKASCGMAKPYSSLRRSTEKLFSEIFDHIDAELEQLGKQLYGDNWQSAIATHTYRRTNGKRSTPTIAEKAGYVDAMKRHLKK